MDRLTRKDLKTDKFAQEVGHTVEFVSEHRSQVIRYGALALVVVAIIAGYLIYSRHQATLREDLLSKAMRIDDAVVSATPQPPLLNFATAEEKEKARIAAYTELSTKYPGTQEGAMAQMVLASVQIEKGQIDQAEKIYKEVADSAPAPFASVAKVSLAEIYSSQGKTADAEKLLRDLIANPTTFVSKESATLALAELLAKSKPEEARKMLEPLSNSPRSAISRAAVSQLGKLTQASNTAGGAQSKPSPESN